MARKRVSLTKAEERFRASLMRSADRLVDTAEKQARAGKPALFRTLCRLAGKGPKNLRIEEAEEETRLDLGDLAKEDPPPN